MKKYAILIFPGLLSSRKLLSEICSGGLQIQTDKFRYIPQPALVKGVDFDTPNRHII